MLLSFRWSKNPVPLAGVNSCNYEWKPSRGATRVGVGRVRPSARGKRAAPPTSLGTQYSSDAVLLRKLDPPTSPRQQLRRPRSITFRIQMLRSACFVISSAAGRTCTQCVGRVRMADTAICPKRTVIGRPTSGANWKIEKRSTARPGNFGH